MSPWFPEERNKPGGGDGACQSNSGQKGWSKAFLQRNAIDDLLTLQRAVPGSPVVADPVVETQAIEATHQIGQFGVIELELQRLDALSAAAQFQRWLA